MSKPWITVTETEPYLARASKLLGDKVGRDIIEGLQAALAHAKGERGRAHVTRVKVSDVDVAGLRKRLGLTQREFADGFQISLSTLRNWEQGSRHPEGPARVLLKVIRKDPQHVIRAIWPDKRKRAA